MDRKLQRHRADSLRQNGFLVLSANASVAPPSPPLTPPTLPCPVTPPLLL